jgi:imidazolonepropionase
VARAILIRGARQLLTLRGPPIPRRGAALRELTIISDGAVLVQDGLIREVNTSRRVEALADARLAIEIDASGCVVMPGFVDCHTHLVAGPRRPVEDDGPRKAPETCWKNVKQTSRRTLEARSLAVLEDFVRHGTTMIEAKSGFGCDEAGEIKVLRTHATLNRRTSMLASTFMGTLWLPPDSSSGEYIDWMCSRMLPLLKRRRLAEFADIRCERDVFSVEQARRYLNAARQLGLIPKMHAGETANIGAVTEAVRLGAASVDHLVFLGEHDVEMLAGSHTIATLLPGPVFFNGSGRYAPARSLIDGGAAIALGTDYNPYTSPSPNMQMAIVLACRKMGMTAAEAISAATINGAHALRRAASRGSIERDKVADLIILRIPDYRDLSAHFGVNLVETTILHGAVVFQRSKIEWSAA